MVAWTALELNPSVRLVYLFSTLSILLNKPL
jgi:hypothetical protein